MRQVLSCFPFQTLVEGDLDMKKVLVQAAMVGLLLLGGVMVAVGQYDAAALPDDEASSVRGAACELWENSGGCDRADSGSNCATKTNYILKSGSGTLKSAGAKNCEGSCGNYTDVASCSTT
jgi:uncharacterized low-complexity protein